jgi:hypothetical protein
VNLLFNEQLRGDRIVRQRWDSRSSLSRQQEVPLVMRFWEDEMRLLIATLYRGRHSRVLWSDVSGWTNVAATAKMYHHGSAEMILPALFLVAIMLFMVGHLGIPRRQNHQLLEGG